MVLGAWVRRTGLVRGAREAIGLPCTDGDGPCPTIVSPFSSPRGSTSIDSGSNSLQAWQRLGIWPCGVQPNAEAARAMRVDRDPRLHRLCVDEVKILQGFPSTWTLAGPTSTQLGMLGNAVPPPMAAAIAGALASAIL